MKFIKLAFMAVVASILVSCGTTSIVPITGRKQRLSVSDQQILSLSSQQYAQYMATAKKSANAAQTKMVTTIGSRVANAVETYLRENGYAQELQNFKWEFNLVENNTFNAFCMPGGKIVVYTGLLPYCQSDDELAAIIGHEVAHAVAKHAAEKLSQQKKAQIGAQALGVLGSVIGVSKTVSDIAQTTYSLGATGVLNKFSRADESEADYMGLVFSAMAGYKPEAAITFWSRILANGGSKATDFFSSHPSDAKRVQDLKRLLPEAQKYYRPRK